MAAKRDSARSWNGLIGLLILFVSMISVFDCQDTMAQEPLVNQDVFIDENNILDAKDLFFIMQQWSKLGENEADFNKDEQVDRRDLLYFINSFHTVFTVEDTPTPTPTVGEDTPTPTPTETATATPTVEVDVTPLPTDTPTEGPSPTPTDTPTEGPTPTLTNTPTEGPSPTPIITPTEGPPTLTVTPTEAPSPTPTDTPTEGPSPTPTPTGGSGSNLNFFVNFDEIDTLDTGGLVTLSGIDSEDLLISGRMPFSNFLEPWFIFNPEVDETGVAFSDPKSAALNSYFGYYSSLQTSVLEIKDGLDTSTANAPTLSFDAAFILEIPAFERISDYLVVEVLRAGSDQWEILDLNGDGQVVTDLSAYNEDNPVALLPGSFDGLFGASNQQNTTGPVTKDDFIHIDVALPASESLRIAFRFESDSSIFEEGIYLDNIRVSDGGGGTNPTIRSIVNMDGGSFYADTENRALITGTGLDGVNKAVFTSRDGESELSLSKSGDSYVVILPRLSNPTASDTASIVLKGDNDLVSDPAIISIQAAPKPVIDTVSPNPFYQGASKSNLTIIGNNFRPAFSGASREGGTSVIVDLGLGDPLVLTDFNIRNLTQLVVDASDLKDQIPGFVNVWVRNEYSGLESEAVSITLVPGSGTGISIDSFRIALGYGFSYEYTPPEEFYPLQTDQSFTLLWDSTDLASNRTSLNIDIAGQPFVVNGQSVNEEAGKVDIFIDSFGATLALAAGVLNVAGDITASISVANGDPVEYAFTLIDPLPPVLYQRDDDWSKQILSASSDNVIKIYGDNFRGQTTGSTDRETPTKVLLYPIDDTGKPTDHPIELPAIEDISDVIIQPIIADSITGEDLLYQTITADWFGSNIGSIPEGETRSYLLRVMNPDSGLYTDSLAEDGTTPITITFEP